MGKYFGTDGVRGVAGADLTCELAMKLGRGAAAVLTGSTGHRPRILIGKDTRQSGDMLEAALTAGLCSVGADVESLGVLPTPAVAYLVKKYNADAGVVISASHNPMEFNGIKIFAGTGYKLPDEVENEIEKHIDNNCADIKLATGEAVGRVSVRADGLDDYVNHLYESIHGDLTGLNVCIDCANGASAAVAQKLFPRLGAKCTFLGVSPDGANINKGVGSTHLDNLEKAVVAGGFDCGIAFDGDADRCLACDELGHEIDGDKVIALLAMTMKEKGRLDGDTAVVTVMSNLGFIKYMESQGIHTEKQNRFCVQCRVPLVKCLYPNYLSVRQYLVRIAKHRIGVVFLCGIGHAGQIVFVIPIVAVAKSDIFSVSRRNSAIPRKRRSRIFFVLQNHCLQSAFS